MGAEYDVFVSYTWDDSRPVDRLLEALERAGLRVWIDRKRVDDFTSITGTVTRGLAGSKALLAHYSAAYPTSRGCQWELTAAFLAGQQAGDPRRRVLVINPEKGSGHIEPVELRDGLYQRPPATDADVGAWDALAGRIARHLATLDAPLGDLLPATGPRWVPDQHTGSTRFVGRATELWRVHSALTSARVGVITGMAGPSTAQVQGMGGIGKTLLAEEYALRFGAAYPGGIFWLRVFGHDDRTRGLDTTAMLAAFDTEVATVAAAVGLPVAELDATGVRAALADWFAQQDRRCLWVVDDVPGNLTVEQVRRLLAPHPLAASLLTTRSRAYGELAAEVGLDVLPDEDAYTLLTSRRAPATPEEEQAARQVVHLLGGHALGVAVAGAVLAQQAGVLDFAELADLLAAPGGNEDEFETLVADLRDVLPTGHERSITRTLTRSLDQLGQDGWEALRVAALLAPAPIPTRLLADILQAADQPQQPTEPEPTVAGQAGVAGSPGRSEVRAGARQVARGLGEAEALSLAAPVDRQQGTWQIHALVARVFRGADPEPARIAVLRTAAVAVLIQAFAAVSDPRQHQELAGVVVHARELTGTVTGAAETTLLDWVARYDWDRGQYAAAQAAYQRVLTARQRVLGDDHPDTLTSMSNLATTRWARGDLGGAQPLEEQVLETRRRTLGEDHPNTLTSMNNLAGTLRDQGDLAGARTLYDQVLETRRRVLGDDHPDTLVSMSNLAVVLRAQEELVRARTLHEQVLETRRRVLGDDHPDTLMSMNNLAATLRDQGDLTGAQTLHEQALAARRRVLGDDHPDTLMSMNNLAGALRDLGDLTGAQALYEQALSGFRRVLGDDHPNTLTSMSNLAGTLRDLGDLTGAEALEEELRATGRRATEE